MIRKNALYLLCLSLFSVNVKAEETPPFLGEIFLYENYIDVENAIFPFKINDRHYLVYDLSENKAVSTLEIILDQKRRVLQKEITTKEGFFENLNVCRDFMISENNNSSQNIKSEEGVYSLKKDIDGSIFEYSCFEKMDGVVYKEKKYWDRNANKIREMIKEGHELDDDNITIINPNVFGYNIGSYINEYNNIYYIGEEKLSKREKFQVINPEKSIKDIFLTTKDGFIDEVKIMEGMPLRDCYFKLSEYVNKSKEDVYLTTYNQNIYAAYAQVDEEGNPFLKKEVSCKKIVDSNNDIYGEYEITIAFDNNIIEEQLEILKKDKYDYK